MFGFSNTGGFGTAGTVGTANQSTTAPAQGGFGGFGTAGTAGTANQSTTAPAQGGFGGFGTAGTAGTANQSTTAPAQGGFGGFGTAGTAGTANQSTTAPAQGGFGGFGTAGTAGTANQSTTVPAQGGFGGFQSPPQPQGFGTASGAGWGQAAAPAQPPATVYVQQPMGLLSSLQELCECYSALDSKCAFRTMVYNVCDPGQANAAIDARRLMHLANGGNYSLDSSYIAAIKANPDPDRLYPFPLHFMQELKQRCEKQKETTKVLDDRLKQILTTLEQLSKLSDTGEAEARQLKKQHQLLQRRWLTMLQKVETLRRSGIPVSVEQSISQRARQIHQLLRAPGSYLSQLQEWEPYMREDTTRIDQFVAIDRSRRPLLSFEIDPSSAKQTNLYIEQAQSSIEKLDNIILDLRRKVDIIHEAARIANF